MGALKNINIDASPECLASITYLWFLLLRKRNRCQGFWIHHWFPWTDHSEEVSGGMFVGAKMVTGGGKTWKLEARPL